jgi:hypothetical protein
MAVRRVIETAFAPLKAISKFIDFLLGFVPYPLSVIKEIKPLAKSLMYGVLTVWRSVYHMSDICLRYTVKTVSLCGLALEGVDEAIKQTAIMI